MKRFVLLLCLLLVCVGCMPARCEADCTRVLFLGNSYTYVNDLPDTFAKLARSGGHQVETGMVAQGGWTLTDLLNSGDVSDALATGPWDYVVLQEQSQIPSVEWSRTNEMYPSARSLVWNIRNANATPVFFLTWAHRDGFPENGLPDYASMQDQINFGYYGIAGELNVPVAPVGVAWSAVHGSHPEIALWQDDGSHPTKAGTYLAACVFYRTIFQESPEGLNYHGGLSKDEALALQQAAAE